MRSSTEVCVRNSASAGGSRDSSSKRKYSDMNRSPPVKPAALAGPGAPACIDSAARYRPAGQPSVCSVSSESASASSSTPAASSSSLASCSSSRRSATPISCTKPCARQRASGSAGSSLLAIAICEPAGTYSNSAASTSRQDGLARAWRSSSTSTSGRSSAPSALPTRGTRLVQVDPPGPDNASNTSGGDRFDAVDRGRDVAQEHDRVVVSPVERDPRERTRISLGPLRQQRRLAVPGGRDHGRERQGRRAQPADHVHLRHGARPGRWRGELDAHEIEGNFRDGHRGASLRLAGTLHLIPIG